MRLTEDCIPASRARTLYGLFRERVRRSPTAEAYRYFNRETQTWQGVTWAQVAALVARWQHALSAEGLAPGTRVALSLRNGVDWVAFDQAALGLGLVTVPLYTDDRPDNSAAILDEAGVELLLVQDVARWKRLAPAVGSVATLRRVLIMEGDDNPEDTKVRAVANWLPPGDFPLRERDADPQELATIAYTSGTGGRPKGVMLSHHNILSVVEAGLSVVTVVPEDSFLSFLPLAHTFERTVGYYLPMTAGATVVYARSATQLGEDLLTVRPTILLAVPRVFERIHTRLHQQLRQGSVLRRWLFALAVKVGWRRFQHRQGRVSWHPMLLGAPLLDRLVGARVRARLGGRAHKVVSGGAPLAPNIARELIGLGVPLLQGYGLTEASPQVSINLPDNNDPASVGLPLPGIEVRIGADDELLVRSPGVMLGYWKKPEATAAAIRDGWLHTGDQARLREGRIYIIGRIKDVLVLSNGEKVPPAEMEMAIAGDPLIDQVMIVGEGRPFLGALVVLNPEQWQEWATQSGLDPDAPESLHDKRLHQEITRRMAGALQKFPSWAKVRRVHAILEPWSVENGMLTPTLKVRRLHVLGRYADALRAMYED